MSQHVGVVKLGRLQVVVRTKIDGGSYYAHASSGGRSHEFEGPTGGAGVREIATTVAQNFATRLKKPSVTPAKARQILHDTRGGRPFKSTGKPITESQRKYFGAMSKGNPLAKGFPVGTRVRKTMGVQLSGVVIAPTTKYTDGTYRHPYSRESVVYVRWDEGGVGWQHKSHLAKEGPRKNNHWLLPLAVGLPAGAALGAGAMHLAHRKGLMRSANPSKKDYEAVARILRDSAKSQGASVVRPIERAFEGHFAAAGGRFDPARFRAAVGVNPRADEMAEQITGIKGARRDRSGHLHVPCSHCKKIRLYGAHCTKCAWTSNGYVYELKGRGQSWLSSSDEHWEVVVAHVTGQFIGTRTIDGSRVDVVKQGSRYFAALPHAWQKANSARFGNPRERVNARVEVEYPNGKKRKFTVPLSFGTIIGRYVLQHMPWGRVWIDGQEFSSGQAILDRFGGHVGIRINPMSKKDYVAAAAFLKSRGLQGCAPAFEGFFAQQGGRFDRARFRAAATNPREGVQYCERCGWLVGDVGQVLCAACWKPARKHYGVSGTFGKHTRMPWTKVTYGPRENPRGKPKLDPRYARACDLSRLVESAYGPDSSRSEFIYKQAAAWDSEKRVLLQQMASERGVTIDALMREQAPLYQMARRKNPLTRRETLRVLGHVSAALVESGKSRSVGDRMGAAFQRGRAVALRGVVNEYGRSRNPLTVNEQEEVLQQAEAFADDPDPFERGRAVGRASVVARHGIYAQSAALEVARGEADQRRIDRRVTAVLDDPRSPGFPRRNNATCARCHGARKVKLGKNLIPCPMCCRKNPLTRPEAAEQIRAIRTLSVASRKAHASGNVAVDFMNFGEAQGRAAVIRAVGIDGVSLTKARKAAWAATDAGKPRRKNPKAGIDPATGRLRGHKAGCKCICCTGKIGHNSVHRVGRTG
jgi:hypothetical protein